MNTHLQLSGLLYVLFIAIIYFRKKKINTIENIIFKSLIIHVIFTTIVDLISRTYAITHPVTIISELLFKTFLWMIVNYTIIFTYYVYCITSQKNVGNVDIKDTSSTMLYIVNSETNECNIFNVFNIGNVNFSESEFFSSSAQLLISPVPGKKASRFPSVSGRIRQIAFAM